MNTKVLHKEFPMVIVTAADDGFAMPMAVTLYSALANLKRVRAVSLHIIDGGISERNRLKLTEVLNVQHLEVQIEWVKPDLFQLNALLSKLAEHHPETPSVITGLWTR